MKDKVTLSDRHSRYEISFPSNWKSQVTENGVIGSTQMDGLLCGLSLVEMKKSDDWGTLSKQQEQISLEYDVLENGSIEILGKKSLWSIVNQHDELNLFSYCITIEHPVNETFFTYQLFFETDVDLNKRICRLSPLLDNFTILMN